MAKRHEELLRENSELRARLEESEDLLHAIRAGEVDAMVMGEQVYAIQGAETPYRILIEAMIEGAAMVLEDGTVLYCNGQMAALLRTPLHAVIGTSLGGFVAAPERPAFEMLLIQGMHCSCKAVFSLRSDGLPTVPVQLSCSPLQTQGTHAVCVVATDLTERKQMEVQLRHAQKLQAVGQLAAGIAHEINTPAQFVGDNLHFLARAFLQLQKLTNTYQKAIPALDAVPGNDGLVRELHEAEGEADLEYTAQQATHAFDAAKEGIERIGKIVQAMKEFAHPGHKEKSPVDLNRALQNTLVIARNEYKYVATVETDFGELPPVVCRLDNLNQVFLNLIVNAAHAIQEVVAGSDIKGRIRVRTIKEGDHVRIEIQDTGCGIPMEIQDRIFEPFFTTKEVGRGSGQGLSIARSVVVDQHRGSLTFESEAGQGTRFTILLPIGNEDLGQP